MDTKTCRMCIIEKHINNFYQKYSECKDCNRTKVLKRHYENKEKISNQQKLYYEKKRERECYYRNKTIDVYNLGIWLYLTLN